MFRSHVRSPAYASELSIIRESEDFSDVEFTQMFRVQDCSGKTCTIWDLLHACNSVTGCRFGCACDRWENESPFCPNQIRELQWGGFNIMCMWYMVTDEFIGRKRRQELNEEMIFFLHFKKDQGRWYVDARAGWWVRPIFNWININLVSCRGLASAFNLTIC